MLAIYLASSQAPITEEIVFRACVLTVYHLADASRMKMIFLSPLVFGAGMRWSITFWS
jgi:hypothetical protein